MNIQINYKGYNMKGAHLKQLWDTFTTFVPNIHGGYWEHELTDNPDDLFNEDGSLNISDDAEIDTELLGVLVDWPDVTTPQPALQTLQQIHNEITVIQDSWNDT